MKSLSGSCRVSGWRSLADLLSGERGEVTVIGDQKVMLLALTPHLPPGSVRDESHCCFTAGQVVALYL